MFDQKIVYYIDFENQNVMKLLDLKKVAVLAFAYIQQIFYLIQPIYLLSNLYNFLSRSYMDIFNKNLVLYIRLAKGLMSLTAISSPHASLLLNLKPTRNIPYAF